MRPQRKILFPDTPPRRYEATPQWEWNLFMVVAFVAALGWLGWMLNEGGAPETSDERIYHGPAIRSIPRGHSTDTIPERQKYTKV